ncbi:class I SAM-dependent methyltransferase [Sciscionella marina]|uniref:class I SAM-dependent methyltransferase n=1 Tax=Sciscionella marina TaxID=508770 RepID=UPI00036ADA93|nr:class I SAM-dependent methyltransferase [Sciscionella marina]
MDPKLTNYLYRNPKLYDDVFRYAETGDKLKEMCHALLVRNGKEPPSSILDIGCGTAFKLAHLRAKGYDCTGVDYQEAMVSYAREQYPDMRFEVGDIRDVRVGGRFDVITCLGWVIENVHSCSDIAKAMATFEAHAKPGTLLVFDTHNPIGDLHGLGSRKDFSIDLEGFKATGQASFTVDRRNQILTRHRTWSLPEGATEQDMARYRLLFPMELERYLTSHGFRDIEMYDNTDMTPTELEGSMLYVTAVYGGGNAQRTGRAVPPPKE